MINIDPINKQIEFAIKEEIIQGALTPGQKISIEELSTRWGVSSTPVRDAIKSLEAKGFLKVSPRKAIYVASLDARSFKEIHDLRIALECLAVELAIPHLTDEQIDEAIEKYQLAFEEYQKTGDRTALGRVDSVVHDLFRENCHNSRLIGVIQDLRDLLDWAQAIVVLQPTSFEDALPEHIAILEQARKRNIQAARDAMRTHLSNAFARTIVRLE